MKYLSDNLQIFDSLSHPSFSGNWVGKSRFKSSSFKELVEEMIKNNICGTIASTYPLNEEIKIYEFQNKCTNLSKKYNLKIYPAWIIDDRKYEGINYLKKIKSINPKENSLTIVKFNANYINYADFKRFKEIIHNSLNLFNEKIIIYICTYPFYRFNNYEGIYDPVSIVDKLSNLNINVPIVLLHGCASRLLDASLYAQHFKNIYIDISFTLCRYINSSLFKDLEYLFEYLDQKIIIGTDHPEYNYSDLRGNLLNIEKTLLKRTNNRDLSNKLSNIFYKNLLHITENF